MATKNSTSSEVLLSVTVGGCLCGLLKATESGHFEVFVFIFIFIFFFDFYFLCFFCFFFVFFFLIFSFSFFFSLLFNKGPNSLKRLKRKKRRTLLVLTHRTNTFNIKQMAPFFSHEIHPRERERKRERERERRGEGDWGEEQVDK